MCTWSLLIWRFLHMCNFSIGTRNRCTRQREVVLIITAVLTQDFCNHDDVIKWKHFPRNWPFVRGIHRSPVNSPHKGQWRGALMFSLICAGINDWVNNREAGDLRRNRAHYDVIVMVIAVLIVFEIWIFSLFKSISVKGIVWPSLSSSTVTNQILLSFEIRFMLRCDIAFI